MKQILILIPALMFAGCESVPKQKTKIIRKVVVRGDNYCKLARRDSWDVRDTKKSIQDARKSNARYQRICSKSPQKPKG